MESIDDLYVRGLESGDVEPIITAMRRGLNIHQIPDADFDPEDPTYHSIIDDAIILNSPVLNALVERGAITAQDLARRRMEISERDELDEVEHEYLRRLGEAERLARGREQAWREGERQAEIEGEQLAREFAELRTLSSLDELRARAEQFSARAREARATRDNIRDDTLERAQASRRYERLRALAEHAESLHADEFIRRREADREYQELYAPDPEIERQQAEADREYQELYAPDPEIERQQAEADREYQELYAPDPEIERQQAEAERAEAERVERQRQRDVERQRQRDVERAEAEREQQREAERVAREQQREAERAEREQQREAERAEREQKKLEKKLERAGLLDYYRELETSGYNFPQTYKEILEHVEGYRDARAETMREEQPVQASLLPSLPQYQTPQRQYQTPQRHVQQNQAPQRQYQAPNLANEFLARRQAPQRQAPSNLANEFLTQRQAQQQARQATRDSLAREFAELERRQNMERVFMEQQIQPLTNPVEIDTIVKEFNNAQAYDRAVLENRAMDFERAVEDEDADFHARREHEAQFLPFDEQAERAEHERAQYGPQADHRGLREPQIRLPPGQAIPPRGANQGQVRLVMQQPPPPPREFVVQRLGPESDYLPPPRPVVRETDFPAYQGGRRGMEVAGMRGALARRY